jgi:hypothetical protein
MKKAGTEMADLTIKIPVDAETAKAYTEAGPEKKQRIDFMLGLWLRGLTAQEGRPLEEVLDEMGRKAEQRGLTPEILADLLKDE